MDNVASHLQRLQLGTARGPRNLRRRPRPDQHLSATHLIPADPHACMRRLLARTFRNENDTTFARLNPSSGCATPVFQVAFARTSGGLHNRTGRLLAAVDEAGVVSLVDTAAPSSSPGPCNGSQFQRVHHQWEAHENAIFDLAWAHDNSFLLTASGDLRASAWDVETQRAIFSLQGGHAMSVKCVRQSADQHDVIATGARDGHVLVWDARTPAKPVAELRGVHSAPSPSPLSVSSSSAQSSPSVHFVSPQSTRKRRKTASSPSTIVNTPRSVTSVEFLGGGHELATAGAVDSVVKIWDLRRLTAQRKIPLQGSVNSASVPLRSYACGSAGTRAQRGITSLALDPTSRSKLLVSVLHDELCVLDVHARENAPVTLRLEGHVASSFYVKAAFSPEGDFVVSGSGDGMVYLWDARNPAASADQTDARAPTLALKAHDGEVNGVAWHASDFTKLASCSDDGTVRVWTADRRHDRHDETLRLRRRRRQWENWHEIETAVDGRAYEIEALADEDEVMAEANKRTSQPSPPVVRRHPDGLTLPSTSSTLSASTTPRPLVPDATPRKRRATPQTLLDFWGR